MANYTQTVLPNSAHAELMNLACKSALLDRGVTHLIFPDEVAGLEAAEKPVGTPEGRITSTKIAPPEDSLGEAVEMLKTAERPVIIVGHGARYDMPAIIELAESLNAPVLTTFKGKGLIPDDHPLGCGVLGRSGTPVASWFMNESSHLLVLGASFSNHTGITPKKPTIQVDLDPHVLGKFHAVDVPVWGELSVTVKLLQERLAGVRGQDVTGEIAERWRIWRDEKTSRRRDDRGQGVNSASIFESLWQTIPDDAILSVDVGNNTYSFGRYFECRRHAVLMSGYLGSIGHSFVGALGAWVATQEDDERFRGRKVVSVSGDGGFGQYMGDFNTAVKYGMDITHVLLNNTNLGKITKEQRAGHWPVWQTSLTNPSFAEYAKICGGFGIQVTQADQLDEAIAQALAHPGPAIVEVMADQELV